MYAVQSAAVSYDKLQAAPDDENSAAVSDDDQSSALITESECSELYLKLMKSNLTVAEKIGTFFCRKVQNAYRCGDNLYFKSDLRSDREME